MSFENIQLPPFLLQDLYKNFLIDEKINTLSTQPLNDAKMLALGSNKKNILILLNEPTKVVIDKKDLAFLEGILKACNLTTEDTSIINIHNLSEINYAIFIQDFQPEKVLLFGVEPAEIKLPLVFPHNQIQQHITQLYVSFPALKIIAGEKSLKQALWATLQKFFKLV